MKSRTRRWLLYALAAIAVAVGAGVIVIARLLHGDAQPRDFEERWVPGPAGLRIRSLSWTEPGSWVDRDRRVHEYSVVRTDGSERRIGQGEEPLAPDALHTEGDWLELVVGGETFRETRHGSWSRFDANGGGFLYRHWSPLPGGHREGDEVQGWRYRAPRQSCRIRELSQREGRLVSICGRHLDTSTPKVTLVFTRPASDAPWEIDESASFAASPPPAHTPFPPRVEGRLVVIRVAPALSLRQLDPAYRRLATLPEHPTPEERGRVPLALEDGARVELVANAGGYQGSWFARGGWLDPDGLPVLFFSENEWNEGRGELFAVPFGEGALVQHSVVTREEASYLVYLVLDAPEPGS